MVQTKPPIPKDRDNEKRWLMTTAGKEQSKSTGFMLRLKGNREKQYPKKDYISKEIWEIMQEDSKNNCRWTLAAKKHKL